MTPGAQRIAIAEACGYTWSEKAYDAGWKRPDGACGGPPDYLSDLNAMHEAEKKLARGQFYKYASEYLPSVVGDTCPVSATAAQRAEAFLRTLNLWDDSK